MLKKIVAAFIFITWPLSLFIANTHIDFLHYILPVIFAVLSFLLYKRGHKYYYLPLFLIPFIEPKFAILPFTFIILNLNKKNLAYLFVSIIIIFLFFKSFYGQSIFRYDYQGQQQIFQEEKLYNSIFMARLFQNKMRIPTTKAINNFLALSDLNNYFFGFAPGQITINNQNLDKFPFLSLPFLLIGVYFSTKNKNWRYLITLFGALIINLSLLTNFDRNDFILWLPLSLIIFYGLNIFDKESISFQGKNIKFANYYYLVFILFATIGILKIFITK